MTPTLSAGVRSGASAPLGATVRPGGVNFSVFSKGASLVELLLFDDENATLPARVIRLDAEEHRTYHYWHVFVPDLKPGQVYPIGRTGLSSPTVDFGSTPRRCSSILTA